MKSRETQDAEETLKAVIQGYCNLVWQTHRQVIVIYLSQPKICTTTTREGGVGIVVHRRSSLVVAFTVSELQLREMKRSDDVAHLILRRICAKLYPATETTASKERARALQNGRREQCNSYV